MKVTQELWKEKMNNLIERRKLQGHSDDNRKNNNILRDYKTHLSKVHIGKSVLDVGCGSMFLKECLPEDVEYIGIDPFPVNENVFNENIEDIKAVKWFNEAEPIDTICAFAVMDGVMDFDKAIENMKLIARKNIVFLTGVDIEVDKYHTLKLSLQDYRDRFDDWKETYCEELTPNVYLLEYSKI